MVQCVLHVVSIEAIVHISLHPSQYLGQSMH